MRSLIPALATFALFGSTETLRVTNNEVHDRPGGSWKYDKIYYGDCNREFKQFTGEVECPPNENPGFTNYYDGG